jgi:hypothetical protein
MKKILFSMLLVVGLYSSVNAQIPDSLKIFKYGGFANFTFNQVTLSHWAAGGEDALSTTAILSLFGNYKKDKVAWDNTLDLGYGLLKNGSSKIRKNEDKMEINSKLGYKAFNKVYYTALLNFRSQFSAGYIYPNDSVPVSRFMAPGYLTVGLGLDYKPNDHFSFYFSPATGKFIFVTDQVLANAGAYGVDSAMIVNGVMLKKGKKLRSEFGASISTQLLLNIGKNVSFISKLLLFNNYTDRDKANQENIDVNWEVMLNMKAGKYLTTSIMTNLIYDQNVLPKTQFKESIGVGLSFKF